MVQALARQDTDTFWEHWTWALEEAFRRASRQCNVDMPTKHNRGFPTVEYSSCKSFWEGQK
eukprot:5823742-Alexandrium_andersonii.AAC.1